MPTTGETCERSGLYRAVADTSTASTREIPSLHARIATNRLHGPGFVCNRLPCELAGVVFRYCVR